MFYLSATKIFIQIAMLGCIVAYTSIYLIGIKKGKVQPVLATWLFFALALVLSFVTNFSQNGVHGLLANSFNLIDIVATIIIFSVVLMTKTTRKAFTVFEKRCIYAVFIIFIFWLVSGKNVLAHLAIQTILILAYLPTLIQLWKSKQNTESLGMWSFDFLASSLGTIEPLRTMAFLPLVYDIRSVLSTMAVISLILYIKYLDKKKSAV